MRVRQMLWTVVAGVLQQLVRMVRRRYLASFAQLGEPNSTRALDLTVYTMLSERDVAQGAAMIRSLLANFGVPRRVVVAIHGLAPSAQRLRAIHPCVELLPLVDLMASAPLDPLFARWPEWDPYRQKAALLTWMPVTGTTMFVDSDVLFHTPAKSCTSILDPSDGRPRFLIDSMWSLDDRIDPSLVPAEPVNSGFIVLHQQPDWRPALEALRASNAVEKPAGHEEQTLVALMMASNSGLPLDPDHFVVSTSDRRSLRDTSVNGAVLRHYTSPIRWKLWIAVAGGWSGVARSLIGYPRWAA